MASRRSAVLQVIAHSVLVLVSFGLAQVIVYFGLISLRDSGVDFSQLGETLLQVSVAALVYILTLSLTIGFPWVALRKKTTSAELGVEKPLSWRDILLSPAALLGYMVLSSLVIYAVTQTVPGFDVEQVQNVGFDTLNSQMDMLMAFLALVVLAPVAEELLFRGYLYGKIRRVAGFLVAALVTSVLFGFVHGQWNVGIDTFILSMVMCGLREVTGTIWAGVLVHMLKNGVAFFFLFVYPITGV